jgi:broad specificity phosphatase PhoE
MARLFLIRHGEPEAAWGGAPDDPGLSATGHRQAEAAAEALEKRGRLQVFSSPMRRCLETAAPYAERTGRPLAIEPRISEVLSPPGTPDRRAWLLENFPWRGGSPRLWSTLAPDLHAWRADMLGFVWGLNEDTAVFTHFIAINVIVGAALKRNETIVCRPGYASATELTLEGGALRLVALGEEMRVGEVR